MRGVYKYKLLVLSILLSNCTLDHGEEEGYLLEKVEDFDWVEMDRDISPSLCEGIRQQSRYLRFRKKNIVFNKEEISPQDYSMSLLKIYEVCSRQQKISGIVKDNFEVFRVKGSNNGDILLTSYFEPVIAGRKEAVFPYTMPLYGVPSDLVEVRINNKNQYGLLKKKPNKSYQVVDYLTRKEIEKKTLKNAKLYAWVKPVDGFFMHIQGSGKVEFSEDKSSLGLGYASQNGHAFYPIGKSLLDVIPLEEMSMDSIRNHLAKIDLKSALAIMYEDPSYIFFQELEGRPQASNGTDVVDGHTIATDGNFFEKGLLGILNFEDPDHGKKNTRFVLNQDRGGAIQGPNRVDLFWGTGLEAGKKAGSVLQYDSALYYLKPKQSSLKIWRENSHSKK